MKSRRKRLEHICSTCEADIMESGLMYIVVHAEMRLSQ